MSKLERFQEKRIDFLFDHYGFGRFVYEARGVLTALIAAFIFAFGFCCFIAPSDPNSSTQLYSFTVITGGVSGLSQNISLFLKIAFGVTLNKTTIEAIGYAGLNLPLLIFAFFKVGKRFALITAVNVFVSSLFIFFFPQWGFTDQIACSDLIRNFPIVRVVFGAICTGLSSAIAFKGEISCGGIDIITYYISLRKSTSVGIYGMIANGCIVSLYTLLLIINNASQWDYAIISLFYSIIYLVVVMIVVDVINLRNKKVQIKFVTNNERLSDILLAHFPHGATICQGKGAFSRTDKIIIYMVVSSNEMKRVVNLARRADPKVFCSVTSLVQVYGNFFIRPIQ